MVKECASEILVLVDAKKHAHLMLLMISVSISLHIKISDVYTALTTSQIYAMDVSMCPEAERTKMVLLVHAQMIMDAVQAANVQTIIRNLEKH